MGLPVVAAPGGGMAVGVAGASAAGGGHAAAAAPAAHSGGYAAGGSRPSVGTASGFHAGPSGLTGAVGYRGAGSATGGIRYAANPGFSNNLALRRAGTFQGASSVSRVNNAWTDPVVSRTGSEGGISRSSGYAANYRRNDPTYGVRPGNHLYSGADGSGRNGNRGNHRYYYNNFPYGVYYPYLYNNYGYGGYGDYGYDSGVADDAGLNTDNSLADLGAPDFSGTPNNYYSYVAPEPEAPNANPPESGQPLPDAPAVGPQGPSTTDKSAAPATQGPDSLVEAVQNELSRRGYFAGKVDSMYSPATKEALRRFQMDQGLPATGRVNEATLHALRLD